MNKRSRSFIKLRSRREAYEYFDARLVAHAIERSSIMYYNFPSQVPISISSYCIDLRRIQCLLLFRTFTGQYFEYYIGTLFTINNKLRSWDGSGKRSDTWRYDIAVRCLYVEVTFFCLLFLYIAICFEAPSRKPGRRNSMLRVQCVTFAGRKNFS